jgi:protein subunit release factor A
MARVRQHLKEEEKKSARRKQLIKKIKWRGQMRSYVFHPSNMVRDHRTHTEISNTQAVYDSDMDSFIEQLSAKARLAVIGHSPSDRSLEEGSLRCQEPQDGRAKNDCSVP